MAQPLEKEALLEVFKNINSIKEIRGKGLMLALIMDRKRDGKTFSFNRRKAKI